jgi:queuine tRNA-ribosyltransferase
MHNLHYYQVLMRELREAIAAGTLEKMVAAFHAGRREQARG